MTNSELKAKVRELLIQKRDDQYAIVPDFKVVAVNEDGKKLTIDSRSGQFRHVVFKNEAKPDQWGRVFAYIRGLDFIHRVKDGVMVKEDEVEQILLELAPLKEVTIEFLERDRWDSYKGGFEYKVVSVLTETDESFANQSAVDDLRKSLAESNQYPDVCLDGNSILVTVDDGDWKHEHGFVKNHVKEFFLARGFVTSVTSETTKENGSDCYSASHTFTGIKTTKRLHCEFSHNCVTCRNYKFADGNYVCFAHGVKAKFVGGVTSGEELKGLVCEKLSAEVK